MFSKLSLRAHLHVILIPLIIPFIALVVYSDFELLQARNMEAGKSTVKLADVVATHISSVLEHIQTHLLELTTHPQVQALDNRECDPAITWMRKTHDTLLAVVEVRKDGELICSTGLNSYHRPFELREMISEAARHDNTTNAMSEEFPLRGGGIGVLESAPILDTNRNLTGIMAAVIDLSPNKSLLKGLTLPKGTLVRLIDAQQHILGGTGLLPESSQTITPSWNIIKTIQQTRRGYISNGESIDSQLLYGLSPVSVGNWKVLVITSNPELQKQVKAIRTRNIVLMLIALFLTALVIRRFNHYLASPVDSLILAAAATIKGTLSEVRTPRGPRELVTLSATFNEMINARRIAEQRWEKLANFDTVTGLPNRTLFLEQLSHALAVAKRHNRMLAILFIDLDEFKVVNDTLGHPFGDKLLSAVAKRLLDTTRADDTLARLGGDEFVLLAEELKCPEDAAALAETLLEVLEQPFKINNQQLYVSASIGIAVYPMDSTDPDSLIADADAAMYRAKARGKNTYSFHTADMRIDANKRLKLKNRLRGALDRSEFLLHYQPQFDISSKKLCGVETLLRWYQPREGFISPAEFVPLLEESGLIVSVGEWIFRQACHQAGAWQQKGLVCPRVAINLSARQFRDARLFEMIKEILISTGIPPSCLEIELTESAIIDNINHAITIMHKLKELGVRLSVDDFGTGYSSLSYLRRFPLDTLKIDRSFTLGLGRDPAAETLTQAIIDMAHGLGMRVIAEGIETQSQLNVLRKIGCDEIQGYLVGRPAPPDLLETTLKIGVWHI